MKRKKNYSIFIFSLLIISASVVYLFQQMDFKLPKILNNYFNDLVALPIVLSVCLWCVRKIQNKPKFQLSFLQCMMMVLFYSWFFEIYLPKTNTRYTADAIDGILYLAGGVLFYWWQRKSN